MHLEGFKLAVILLSDFSDHEVEALFSRLPVFDEKEIEQIVRVLQKHRPALLQRIIQKYLKNGDH